MELKPGYKQTEVGVIPEDWEVSPLIGKISITHGFAFASQHFSSHGPFRLTTPGHFFEKGGFRNIGEKQKYFTGSVPAEFVLEGGDMIVAMTEQADGLLGSAAFIPVDDKYLHNQRLGRVRALTPEIDLDYLYYIFNSIGFRAKVRETAAGTKVKHTSPVKLLQIPVQIPPVAEQEAIAMTLKRLEALVDSLENLLAKKQNIKQAAMQELLTGKRRLPGFEGEWEVKRLGDIGKCLRGVSYKGESDLMAYDTATTRRLLRSNNIQGSFLTTNDVKHVNSQRVAAHQIMTRGDILICMANGSKALVGKAGRFHINDGYEYTFGAFMGCFRTVAGLADPEFVSYLFQTGRYQLCVGDLLAGSSINNLKPSSIESLEFEFPSQAEQTAIAAVLSDIDTELTALEAIRDKTRALKQAMMQELLTGRIRLR